jgi:hypothetical protein
MSTTRAIAVGVAVLCLAVPALATWSHNPDENNLVCGANDAQTDPAIAPDGEGGVFVAWEDRRVGLYEIYVQHLDSRGVPFWTTDGVEIGGSAFHQTEVQIVADGLGGAILVWRDWYSTAIDIYAQRIDASGSAVWPSRGVLVCGADGIQQQPQVLSDGEGGAFIAWLDSRPGATTTDVYAQRLDASGDTLWAVNSVPVCTAVGTESELRMVSDGQNGIILSWEDPRANDGDIYVQRINAAGSPEWTLDGIALCNLSTEQYEPRIVSDEAGGAIVTWCDHRDGSTDIYAQRVGVDGNALWTADGIPVCVGAAGQAHPRLTCDGAHGAIISWNDHGAGTWDIYAQRVSAGGTALWTANGVAVSAYGEHQEEPEICSDGAGGAVIAWQDDRALGTDIYARRVGGSGNVLWATDGVAVSTAAGSQTWYRVVTDGEGGGIITWDDSRGVDSDIYAQRIERNGYLGYPSGEIHAVRDVPGDQGGQVNLAWNGSYLDPWPLMEIDNYTLWRAISPTRDGVPLSEGTIVLASVAELPADADGPVFLIEERARGTFYWELVATVDAYHLETYAEVVPTLFDSTATSGEYHYFRTIAHASDPTFFWVSLPDSGHSVDNLAPGAPLALLAGVVNPDVELLWSPSGYHDEDLGHYNVHRSEVSGFVPDGTTFIGAVTDTAFTDSDPGPTTWYYRVVAEDIHGNEGDPSNEAVATLGTGIDDAEIPAVFALRGSFPNPLNPTTRVVFDLPTPAHVTIDVYSIGGRHVATLVDGPMGAGQQAVQWDGTDDEGADVPGGVYLYKVEAGSEQARGKIVVVR